MPKNNKRGNNPHSQSKLGPIKDELANELKQLGVTDRIIDIVIREKEKPEGKVRLVWLRKLVKEYRFPASHIDIEVPAGVGRDAGKKNIPVRADIVVYRDLNRTEAFAVIETKQPKEKEGIEQAESYARNLGSEYHLWSNGTYENVFKTSKYPNKSQPILRLPVWIVDKPLVKKVPKTEMLRPFKDEEELRQVIGTCHDLILEKLGHDPAKAFDEITKLLFLKLYDEKEVPNYYEFAVFANEIPHELGTRIRKLFEKAISSSKYQDVFWSQFNTEPVPITLELDDFSIFNIVQRLQGYSLVNTTENIQGADIKGTVYEQMVGKTFRGELAQFFTPREIVDFMVEVIEPNREDKILDPACGSGGFLIMTLRKLREWIQNENPNLSEADVRAEIRYSAEHKLFGIDINDRMVRVAKMNMIMHGDGHAGIFHILRGGGLLTDPNLPSKLSEELKEGTVDVIFSNPPFAGREKDPAILKKFELGVNEKGKPINVSKEVLFIEKIIRLLAKGGKAGLMLPSGVFNNISMERVRDYIRKYCKIIAIIALPAPAFEVSGAHNEGNLLFIEKVDDVPKDYDVFIDWASYVGFESTGKKIKQNDLPGILQRFKNGESKNIIKFSELEERIDPWYYHPEYKRIESEMQSSGYKLRPILEICKVSDATINSKENSDKQFRYIETNDVDLMIGKIVNYTVLYGRDLPNRAKYILAEGDFLIPNHRHCIRGVAIATKEDEGIICTNRFYVVKPNLDEIEPAYFFYLLKQEEVLTLMRRESTGEINPSLNWRGLEKIKVPVPDKTEQTRILKIIDKDKGTIESLRKQIEKHLETLNDEVRTILPFKYKLTPPQNLGSEFIAENRRKKEHVKENAKKAK